MQAPVVDEQEVLRRKAALGDAYIARGTLGGRLEYGHGSHCESEPKGRIGPIPPLSVDCFAGPRHECLPVATPKELWEYDESLLDDPAFRGYRPVEGYADLVGDKLFSAAIYAPDDPDARNKQEKTWVTLEHRVTKPIR